MRAWGSWWCLVLVACGSESAVDHGGGAGAASAAGAGGTAVVAGAGGDAATELAGGAGGVVDADAIDCSELYDGDYGQDEGEYEHDSAACGAGEYCVVRPINPELLSGFEDCASVPEECPASGRPVCGQDGKRYASECGMHQARMDFVSYEASCPDDLDGYYRCGSWYCREGVEYCAARGWQDTWDLNRYECVASECVADGGCDCLGGELGVAGQGGAGHGAEEWGGCSDEQPRRIYVQRDGFAVRP